MAGITSPYTKHHLRRRSENGEGVQISLAQFLLGVACLWPFIFLSLLASSSPQFDPKDLTKVENNVARNLKFEVRNILDRVDVMGYGPTHPRVAFVIVGDERQNLLKTVENIFGNTDMNRIFLVCVVADGIKEDENMVDSFRKMESGSVPHWHGMRADGPKLGRKDSNDSEEDDVHGRKVHVIFNPDKMGIAASRNDAAQFVRLLAEKHEKAGIKSTQEDLLLLLLKSGAEFTSKNWLTPVTGALIVPPPLLGEEDTNVAMKLANAVSFNIKGQPPGKRTSFDASLAEITTDANAADVLLAAGISYPTPALNGAAVAMRLETYLNLPAQDNSLKDLWSANLDLALNLWLCADGIDIIKDLTIAAPPSTSKPMEIEYAARFAAAWMDDIVADKFYQAYLKIVPTVTFLEWEIMNAAAFQGNSFPKDLIQKCRSFEWYIENINTDVTDSILVEEKKIKLNREGNTVVGMINNRDVEEKEDKQFGKLNEIVAGKNETFLENNEDLKESIQKLKEGTLEKNSEDERTKSELNPEVITEVDEKQFIDDNGADQEKPLKLESNPEKIDQIEEKKNIDDGDANKEILIELESNPKVVNQIEEKQLYAIVDKETRIKLEPKPEDINQNEEKHPDNIVDEDTPIKSESKPEVINQIEEKQLDNVVDEDTPIKSKSNPEAINQIEEKLPDNIADEETSIKLKSKPDATNEIEEKKLDITSNIETAVKEEPRSEEIYLEKEGRDQIEEMQLNITEKRSLKVDEQHLQKGLPEKSLPANGTAEKNILEKPLPIPPIAAAKEINVKPSKPLCFACMAIIQQAEPYDIAYVDVSNGHKEHPHMGARDSNGNLGYVHDEKALHRNAPKVWWDDHELERECSVRDDNWHMLTEKVYVDVDAAAENDKENNRKRDKIFCLVYTIESGHPRIPAIRQTWGKKCDGFMVASNRTDARYGTVDIPHIGPEEYGNIWQKVRSMWSYVYDNYYEEYDWFHIGGDDLFLIVDNLRDYLESEEIRAAGNGGIYLPIGNETEQYPLFLGRRFKYGGNERDIFNSGGSGYTMNKAALKLLVVKGFQEYFQDLKTFSEDLTVARTLRKYNVYPYETKDDTGAERYMPFMPGHHYSYKIPPQGDKDWYPKYSIHIKEGLDHCAGKSVAFHYVKGNMMKRLFALLYHLCPEETYRH